MEFFEPNEIERIDPDVFNFLQYDDLGEIEELIAKIKNWLHDNPGTFGVDELYGVGYGRRLYLPVRTEHFVELFDFERARIEHDVLVEVDALHGETHDAVADRMKRMLRDDLHHTVDMTDFANIVRSVEEEDEEERRQESAGYTPRARQFSQPPQCLPEITSQMVRLVYQQMPREIANLYLSFLDYASYYEMWTYASEIQRMQDILDERHSSMGLFDDMVRNPSQVERVRQSFVERGGEIRDYMHLVNLPRGEVVALSSMAGRLGAMLGCGSMPFRKMMVQRVRSKQPLVAASRSMLHEHPVELLVPANPSRNDAWADAWMHRQVPVMHRQVPAQQSRKRGRRRNVHPVLSDSDDDDVKPTFYKAKRPSKQEPKPKEGGTRKRKSKFNKVKKSRKH
jgi:hypothetical protein